MRSLDPKGILDLCNGRNELVSEADVGNCLVVFCDSEITKIGSETESRKAILAEWKAGTSSSRQETAAH
jgi:hypothetical protein